jgi:hypothetical protein
MPIIQRQIEVSDWFFGNFLIGTGQRVAANLAQEFILSRVTRRARSKVSVLRQPETNLKWTYQLGQDHWERGTKLELRWKTSLYGSTE